MVVVQELIRSLVLLVDLFFTILYWLLVIRIVLSWFGVSPYTHSNELLGAVFQVTDVILIPFRKLPLRVGMIDFSAVVAFVALQFVQQMLHLLLLAIGRAVV